MRKVPASLRGLSWLLGRVYSRGPPTSYVLSYPCSPRMGSVELVELLSKVGSSPSLPIHAKGKAWKDEETDGSKEVLPSPQPRAPLQFRCLDSEKLILEVVIPRAPLCGKLERAVSRHSGDLGGLGGGHEAASPRDRPEG